MDFSRYTNKAQQAVHKAQGIAGEYHHNAIEPVHVFLGLMEQDGGLAPRIIQKIGAQPAAICMELEAALGKLPRTSQPSSGMQIGRASLDAFNQAEKEAQKMRDEYTSTEHLLLALAKDKAMGAILKLNGVTYDDVLQDPAINPRQPTHHQHQDPESTYESLSKFGRDLTADARQGKLDPVIGRDEEIPPPDPRD